MDQIDVRGWAHSLGGDDGGDNLVRIGRGAHIMLLLSSLIDASPEVKNQYWSWIEERVLVPIKEEDPDLYSWIIESQRRQVRHG